ncbi:hypothetical protein BGZ49_010108 [Haplosporangium sp. Z 27]|nr:hypothetical protein BGZ49_010108 [Haplosporangium sp. Z 27]
MNQNGLTSSELDEDITTQDIDNMDSCLYEAEEEDMIVVQSIDLEIKLVNCTIECKYYGLILFSEILRKNQTIHFGNSSTEEEIMRDLD